jgi:transcriptional regulator with XRE-family HTH domain
MFSRRPNPVFSDEYGVIRAAVVAARKDAGMTQSQLAARLGKAKSHVAMIERGQRRIDSLELYAMATAFGLDTGDFFADLARRLDDHWRNERESSAGGARAGLR